ncbi:MAG: Nif3-like dinuclear metal center hexameric protein [Clostridia bacterium]|nr:Nif3-like dinuclear metal center hexameric protein [Clostridia bacterium]
MTRVKEINSLLEEKFPLETALDYDNPGFIVGSSLKEVRKIYIALDVTRRVISNCVKGEYDMLITHHPLIFGGINNVRDDNPCGSSVIELIKNDIAYSAHHTNLDYNDKYSNLLLARAIWGENAQYSLLPKDKVFCGVCAEFGKTSLNETMKLVGRGLNASGVISFCNQEKFVSKAFIQGGSFDEDSLSYVLDNGFNLVISGEIKHHVCVLLENNNISTIIAGHNATERIYLPALKKIINDKYPDIEIFVDFGNESFA